MRQVEYQGKETSLSKADQTAIYEGRLLSFGGLDFDFTSKRTFDDRPEKRTETYEKLWREGDFQFWLANYYDLLFDDEANTEAYNFW